MTVDQIADASTSAVGVTGITDLTVNSDVIVKAILAALTKVGIVSDVPVTIPVKESIPPGVTNLRGACNWLCLSEPSVRLAMQAGHLRPKLFGSKPLFPISELERFVASMPSWEPK